MAQAFEKYQHHIKGWAFWICLVLLLSVEVCLSVIVGFSYGKEGLSVKTWILFVLTLFVSAVSTWGWTYFMRKGIIVKPKATIYYVHPIDLYSMAEGPARDDHSRQLDAPDNIRFQK